MVWIAALASECVPVTLTDPPVAWTFQIGCPVTFSVTAAGSLPLHYQWFRNGQPVPGETNSSYAIARTPIEFNGNAFWVTVTTYCSVAATDPVILTTSGDVVPPRLTRARGDATLEQVVVSFASGGFCSWPPLDSVSAQRPENYTVSGSILVKAAKIEPDGQRVILTTSRLTPGAAYTLTVNNVRDQSGNSVEPNSNVEFQAWDQSVPGEPVLPPRVRFTPSGDVLMVNWPTGSVLQFADDPGGPWFDMAEGGQPRTITVVGSVRYFRADFGP